MKKYLQAVFLFLIVALSVTAQASAQQHVDIELIPSVETAVAGKEFNIILQQDIDPHWHTYWRNPGESGFPVQASWDLSGGVTVSEFSWPVPMALDVQGIMNFVHEDRASLIATVSVPEDFKGNNVEIKLTADWLVCKEICIPESGEVAVSIAVGAETILANEGAFQNAFDALPVKYSQSINPVMTVNSNEQVMIEIDNNAVVDAWDETQDVVFFPHDWGLVKAGSRATIEKTGATTKFFFPRSDRDLSEIETFEGVLAQGSKGLVIDVKALKAVDGASSNVSNETNNISVMSAIFFALIGGMILNLMPCVFPILSMKALSLVKIAEKSKSESLKHGLSYTAGILVSFIALALITVSVKATGSEIGWGFQLQNPFVILVMTWLLFAIGLNLLGVFDVTGRWTQIGSTTVAKSKGLVQDFLTGVLAVIVATPCTAPFMGAALGFALVQPAVVTVAIFSALGLGLALPFLLLSILPALQKIMPKPGAWMDTFKQFLAFPMFATSIWLAWVLVQQVGAAGVVSGALGALILAFVAWFLSKKPKNAIKIIIVVLCVLGLFKLSSAVQITDMLVTEYTPQNLEEALDDGTPVFVNMTAAWCITCKVNERVIKSDSIQEIFRDKGVQYIEGDWTLMNADITKYLESFDRTGVPLYVYYDKNNETEPVVLPQILTPNIIKETVQ